MAKKSPFDEFLAQMPDTESKQMILLARGILLGAVRELSQNIPAIIIVSTLAEAMGEAGINVMLTEHRHNNSHEQSLCALRELLQIVAKAYEVFDATGSADDYIH